MRSTNTGVPKMPDLVARLSGLHATLTQRLTLQESLLSLSGRLDMVISQIEMRSSGPPAPLPMPKNKSRNKANKPRESRRYVEGESDDEGEEQMEVEVESADEEGSIEEVELGGSDEESIEGSEEDEDEDEDDDEDEEGDDPTLGGFIDDEAVETDEDEDEDESE